MGQFVFGLLAGIVVGLVMEWIIDWTGLLPKASTSKQTSPKRPQQGSPVLSHAKNEDVVSVPGAPGTGGLEPSPSTASTDEG